jgi:hypothetical protein
MPEKNVPGATVKGLTPQSVPSSGAGEVPSRVSNRTSISHFSSLSVTQSLNVPGLLTATHVISSHHSLANIAARCTNIVARCTNIVARCTNPHSTNKSTVLLLYLVPDHRLAVVLRQSQGPQGVHRIKSLFKNMYNK